MSSILICPKNSGTPNASCHDIGVVVWKRMVLGASANNILSLKDSSIDGVPGFDDLRELAIDPGYEVRKIYLRQVR